MMRSEVTEVSDGSEAPMGWVRVLLPGIQSGQSAWCEWPTAMLGKGLGLWMPPARGQPCLIDFAEDDELQEEPFVIRAYYDEDWEAPGGDLKQVRLAVSDDITLLIQVGDLRITVTEDVVNFGGANYRLARADLVEARLNALEQAYNSHTHIAATLGGPTSAPAVPATLTQQHQTASTLVKAKE